MSRAHSLKNKDELLSLSGLQYGCSIGPPEQRRGLLELSNFTCKWLENESGGTRIRTGDTMIFSHVLYQLSYPADQAAA